MRWHLKELIGRAESVTGERFTYRTISEETGISTNTLTILATGKAQRADLATLDKLLNYFEKKIGEQLDTSALLKHYSRE